MSQNMIFGHNCFVTAAQALKFSLMKEWHSLGYTAPDFLFAQGENNSEEIHKHAKRFISPRHPTARRGRGPAHAATRCILDLFRPPEGAGRHRNVCARACPRGAEIHSGRNIGPQALKIHHRNPGSIFF